MAAIIYWFYMVGQIHYNSDEIYNLDHKDLNETGTLWLWMSPWTLYLTSLLPRLKRGIDLGREVCGGGGASHRVVAWRTRLFQYLLTLHWDRRFVWMCDSLETFNLKSVTKSKQNMSSVLQRELLHISKLD